MYGASPRFGASVSLYSKPLLTIPQQIDLLRSRGMVIDRPHQAEECLQRVGYYRLSAYWYPFRESHPDPAGTPAKIIDDDFQSGTTFTAVFDLYVFDKKLRLLMLDALERIEIAVRSDVARILGARMPTAHREPAELDDAFAKVVRRQRRQPDSTDHQEWLSKLDTTEQRSREDFVKHFKKTYPGSAMPIWISIELWDFGMLSRFVEGMKSSDQIDMATRYGVPRGDLLVSWLKTLNFVRNVCAHHARLWNKPLVMTPKRPAPRTVPLLDHVMVNGFATSRLYAAAAITCYLLRTVNPSTSWAERLRDLAMTFPSNSCVEFYRSGFPNSWVREDLWRSPHA